MMDFYGQGWRLRLTEQMRSAQAAFGRRLSQLMLLIGQTQLTGCCYGAILVSHYGAWPACASLTPLKLDTRNLTRHPSQSPVLDCR